MGDNKNPFKNTQSNLQGHSHTSSNPFKTQSETKSNNPFKTKVEISSKRKGNE